MDRIASVAHPLARLANELHVLATRVPGRRSPIELLQSTLRKFEILILRQTRSTYMHSNLYLRVSYVTNLYIVHVPRAQRLAFVVDSLHVCKIFGEIDSDALRNVPGASASVLCVLSSRVTSHLALLPGSFCALLDW